MKKITDIQLFDELYGVIYRRFDIELFSSCTIDTDLDLKIDKKLYDQLINHFENQIDDQLRTTLRRNVKEINNDKT